MQYRSPPAHRIFLRRTAGPYIWVTSEPDQRVLGQLMPGGFNRSAQHLLIYRDEEVEHGEVQDTVHGEAEGSNMGTLEEWTKRLCDHSRGASPASSRLSRLPRLVSANGPDAGSLDVFQVKHEDLAVADLTRARRVGDDPGDLLDLVT